MFFDNDKSTFKEVLALYDKEELIEALAGILHYDIEYVLFSKHRDKTESKLKQLKEEITYNEIYLALEYSELLKDTSSKGFNNEHYRNIQAAKYKLKCLTTKYIHLEEEEFNFRQNRYNILNKQLKQHGN